MRPAFGMQRVALCDDRATSAVAPSAFVAGHHTPSKCRDALGDVLRTECR
ncbi:hypothetical protein AKL17_1p0025 (plasmid) [Frigidibacter mobilis]|uniref:Uncharacterized protein n=1 Tax=Frigidibacter mobilis TaxID=1335048 RepID=A0A159Z8Y1_9RHOB|nr:hypothetical protein AKL17_1p0025 [Frigidibacter mobilis]